MNGLSVAVSRSGEWAFVLGALLFTTSVRALLLWDSWPIGP